ncbi:MAG: AAA family ATPase, partial [Clostridia bacterium]|nr:AAA family ATPase [Clostridia bacterium]
MLNTLRIQNLALIPAVEINFGEHFNVLTGETGAGKSIIIGSLNFIFGDKLSVNAIRHGAEFARVTAVFDDTIIVRTLHTNGKSEIRVNDEPMTLKGLREVASNLIDIHGQHDTEKLLDAKNHLSILDAFAKTNLVEYQEAYNQLQSLKNELVTYGDNPEERARLLDLYQYQINEIEQAGLTDDEEGSLQQRALVLRNA